MAERATMTALIAEVRTLTNAGTVSSDTGTYFSGETIQGFLDTNRRDLWQVPLQMIPRPIGGGSTGYFEHRVGYGMLEATDGGTSIFTVRDGLGATVGTASYSVDYRRGMVTFGTNTGGSARYLDARTYDVYGASADLLESWAARESLSFDAQTEDQRFTRSQKQKMLLEMAARYRAQSMPATMLMVRGDAC